MNRERQTDRQIDILLRGKDTENSGPEPETDSMGVSGERFRGPHGDSFLKAEEQKPVAGLSDSQAGGRKWGEEQDVWPPMPALM